MKTIIQIKNNNSNPVDLTEAVIEIQFRNAKTNTRQNVVIPVLDEKASFEYEDDLTVKGQLSIVLRSAAGIILSNRKVLPLRVLGIAEFNFNVNNSEINIQNDEPLINPIPETIQGKLIDVRAKLSTDNIQILISVSSAESPETFVPLYTTTTEAGGYFNIPLPTTPFAAAQASIGIALANNSIPIPLTFSEEGGFFPKRLILVFESEVSEEDHEDCGCEQSMYKSQGRVLEEFSFYSVVRTSDPEIQAYNIVEEEEISLEDITNIIPGLFFPLFDVIKLKPAKFFGKVKPFIQTTPATRPTSGIAVTEPVISIREADLTHSLSRAVVRDANFENINPLSDNQVKEVLQKKIKKSTVRNFLEEHKAINTDNFHLLLQADETTRLRSRLAPEGSESVGGRLHLDASNQIDWDDKPTVYEATTIAYGHLLHFKQQWIADGYSLGDLIYSLPLAPGQKKQIVTYDWEHRLRATDTQSLTATDAIESVLSRDRDIQEIATGAITERMHGSSSSTVKSVAGGIGGAIGPIVFGAAGGISKASSQASQQSMRNIAASNSQQLSDRIKQSASSVRSQRSTVIQTVTQGETSSVTTESVANYNHCHAITIQYFEVLRHFKIQQKLADAQECLFVPLPITIFTLDKALRWKEILSDVLIDRSLRKAFKSLTYVKDEFEHSNYPTTSFAEENILHLSGTFQMKLDLVCPADRYNAETKLTEFEPLNWNWMQVLGLGDAANFYQTYLAGQPNKDEIFRKHFADKIAQKIVDRFLFHHVNENGLSQSVNLDASFSSSNAAKTSMQINFRGVNIGKRISYQTLQVSLNTIGGFSFATHLPLSTRILLTSGRGFYRTQHRNDLLFHFPSLNDDLSATDGATIFCGPTSDELVNPRDRDILLSNELIHHLNANLEYYHTEIFKFMTPERRFMLLDGIQLYLPKEKQSRSVASLVENRLIGIVGNSMVFPVIPGLNINPDFSRVIFREDREEVVPLIKFYEHEPLEPMQVSIPTRGVFAEAMMGKCNSCEIKDENRYWRWEESPIPDSPTIINPVSLSTPQIQTPSLAVNPLSTPIVNIQNAPDAPAPNGLSGILGALGKNDNFENITGLTENQKNAMTALQASLTSAEGFAAKGLDKAKFDKMADLLREGKISKMDFQNMVAEGAKPADLSTAEGIKKAHDEGKITDKTADVLGQATNLSFDEKAAKIKDLLDKKLITQKTADELIAKIVGADLLKVTPEKPAAPANEKPASTQPPEPKPTPTTPTSTTQPPEPTPTVPNPTNGGS